MTKKFVGILVFTDEKTLHHKMNDGKQSENRWFFWETTKFPKRFLDNEDIELRVYMAVKGVVRGYFVINDYDPGHHYKATMDFISESWHEIKNGDQLKPSQGWRYYPKGCGL